MMGGGVEPHPTDELKRLAWVKRGVLSICGKKKALACKLNYRSIAPFPAKIFSRNFTIRATRVADCFAWFRLNA